ncbi:MAG: hypothetical protein AAB378_00510 [Patescibacteria group bacterium]
MTKKRSNHKYLLHLYAQVDDFLSNQNVERGASPESIVSFCTVVEKILKLKLHNKNPILVFDALSAKDDHAISMIALKKELDIKTARIGNILTRFQIMFGGIFTSDELQALRDIYEVRNCFMHGYKSDDKINFDPEDIVKKMGTIWERVSKIAVSLFGKTNIQESRPKKKYSKQELERALIDEVKIKVGQKRSRYRTNIFGISPGVDMVGANYWSNDSKCPRCGAYGFAFQKQQEDFLYNFNRIDVYGNDSSNSALVGLYKCLQCNLELTAKEYEIARKISEENLDKF